MGGIISPSAPETLPPCTALALRRAIARIVEVNPAMMTIIARVDATEENEALSESWGRKGSSEVWGVLSEKVNRQTSQRCEYLKMKIYTRLSGSGFVTWSGLLRSRQLVISALHITNQVDFSAQRQ